MMRIMRVPGQGIRTEEIPTAPMTGSSCRQAAVSRAPELNYLFGNHLKIKKKYVARFCLSIL
jgi:hypothetical protein